MVIVRNARLESEPGLERCFAIIALPIRSAIQYLNGRDCFRPFCSRSARPFCCGTWTDDHWWLMPSSSTKFFTAFAIYLPPLSLRIVRSFRSVCRSTCRTKFFTVFCTLDLHDKNSTVRYTVASSLKRTKWSAPPSERVSNPPHKLCGWIHRSLDCASLHSSDALNDSASRPRTQKKFLLPSICRPSMAPVRVIVRIASTWTYPSRSW